MLIIKRIHVAYHLRVDADADRETIDRVHGFHADYCPVARSIGGSIDITTEVDLEPIST